MSIVWTYSDVTRRSPMIGGDEYLSRTILLPWPFGQREERKAICFVITPWWLTRCAIRQDYRTWARWQRTRSAWNGLPDDELEVFERLWSLDNPQPPTPKCFARHIC